MYMGNIRRTVVPKIQGCIQTEQWLQPVATVLWIFQFYHRVSHINEQLNSFTIAEFNSWGHLIALFWYLLYLIRVTSLHGIWELQCYEKQHYAITSCLVATSDIQYPHSFLCYPDIDHSDLTTRNCTISLINGNRFYFHTGIVKFATLCATIQRRVHTISLTCITRVQWKHSHIIHIIIQCTCTYQSR